VSGTNAERVSRPVEQRSLVGVRSGDAETRLMERSDVAPTVPDDERPPPRVARRKTGPPADAATTALAETLTRAEVLT
jgi:hypothetical protein